MHIAPESDPAFQAELRGRRGQGQGLLACLTRLEEWGSEEEPQEKHCKSACCPGPGLPSQGSSPALGRVGPRVVQAWLWGPHAQSMRH